MSIGTATGVLGRVRRATKSDEQLLARARRGDAGCFEEIYRRYRPSLFGYCLLRLMDRQAAEDATQEVFIKASATAGSPIENVKAWLFTIAHNVVIDASRRRAAAPALLDLETIVDSVGHAVDETAFSALDVTMNVFIALRRLPARERKALVLREFHDKSSQEIADELDTRASNIDVLLCRARAAFGFAYAAVSELPLACRHATETIYRQSGSGASDHQLALMEAHLAICPRCREEHRSSHAPRFLGGFIPLLWSGLQSQELAPHFAKLRTTAESAVSFLGRFTPSGLPGPAKATILVVIAVTAFTPAVAEHVTLRPAPKYKSGLVPLPAGSGGSTARVTSDVGGVGRIGGPSPDTHLDTSHVVDGWHTEAHPKSITQTEGSHSSVNGHDARTAGSHVEASHSEPVTAAHSTAGAGTYVPHDSAVVSDPGHTEPAPGAETPHE